MFFRFFLSAIDLRILRTFCIRNVFLFIRVVFGYFVITIYCFCFYCNYFVLTYFLKKMFFMLFNLH